MSGWSLLSGVKINTKKLRTFGFSWGRVRHSATHLKIHGEKWKSVLVDINSDGIMSQLGVVWNMDLNNARQSEDLSSKLKELGGRIVRHQGRIVDKIMALEYCLRSTVAYRMQICVSGAWGIMKNWIRSTLVL